MDRKATLMEAFDKAESDEDETVVLADGEADASLKEGTEDKDGSGEPAPTPEENQDLAAAKGGKKLEKVSSDGVGAKSTKIGEDPKKKDDALDRAAQAAAGGEVGKAPVSWKPAAKAEWAKLPMDVRQDVLRREKEMQQYISQNDHHRKFTEGFGKVVQPFMPLIQAQGSTPLQAVKNMMVTAAGLAQGNTEQKARIVAEIIGNYGIDIQTLDKILSGNPPPPSSNRGNASVDPALLNMLQPIQGFMTEVQQAKQRNEERKQKEAEEAIEKASVKPFFDDLSADIADVMEISAKRGIELTVDEAYEKALALNPEVSKLVASQRAQEQARLNGGTRLSQKRRIASTIAGAPNGGGDGKTIPKSRKEALEAAWEEGNQ